MERQLARALLIIVAAIAAAWLLCSCGTMVPQQRTESAASRFADNVGQKAAWDFAGKIDPTFWPSVTVSNIGAGTVAVTMPVAKDVAVTTTSRGSAGSTDDFTYELIKSIPLGVRIALVAIGIALFVAALLFAYRYVRNTALGVALSKADNVLAAKIRNYRTRAVDTTATANDKAFFATEIAELESERGRLAASTKEDK